MLHHNQVSPEVAYKFLSKQFNNFPPDTEEALKKSLLIPGSTPERVANVLMERLNGFDLDPVTNEEMRLFTIKALEHMQFLAQVEAGTYQGGK